MRTARNEYGFPVVRREPNYGFMGATVLCVVFWGGVIWFANRVWESLAK